MPRFFFHTEDGRCYPDHDGSELPDLETAQREAVVALGELLREDPRQFWNHGRWRLIVRDESDLCLFVLQVVKIEADGAAADGGAAAAG